MHVLAGRGMHPWRQLFLQARSGGLWHEAGVRCSAQTGSGCGAQIGTADRDVPERDAGWRRWNGHNQHGSTGSTQRLQPRCSANCVSVVLVVLLLVLLMLVSLDAGQHHLAVNLMRRKNRAGLLSRYLPSASELEAESCKSVPSEPMLRWTETGTAQKKNEPIAKNGIHCDYFAGCVPEEYAAMFGPATRDRKKMNRVPKEPSTTKIMQ